MKDYEIVNIIARGNYAKIIISVDRFDRLVVLKAISKKKIK